MPRENNLVVGVCIFVVNWLERNRDSVVAIGNVNSVLYSLSVIELTRNKKKKKYWQMEQGISGAREMP